MHRISTALFVIALALLPAAEWRSIILPVSGKPIGFDPLGQASASPFDIVFLVFCISLVPAGIRFLRERVVLSPLLAHWWAALGLLALMLATNEHIYPFLTPAVRKVVDARSLLIHACVMIGVAIFLVRFRIETLVRGTLVFGIAAAVLYAVVSALALAEVPLFTFRYPFTNATHVVFPFPTYNVASGFLAVACLGLAGASYSLRKAVVIVICVPLFLLASALTGSRSGLFLLLMALMAFAASVLVPAMLRGVGALGARQAAWTVTAVVCIAALLLGFGQYWQPIQRAQSILADVARNPTVLVWGQLGSPRYELWRLARQGSGFVSAEENRQYSVRLVSIKDGCVRESAPVDGLQPGARYWLRLAQMSGENSGRTTVQVFRDARFEDFVGETTITHKGGRLDTFSMYLADTGKRYVIQAGTVGEFGVAVDGKRLTEDPLNSVSYFDPLSGAPGAPVVLRGDHINISAHERKIRGFINWAVAVPAPARQLVLQYQISLDRITYTLPLDSPVMFYVGVHDSRSESGQNWSEIRNGLLIEHRRKSSNYERDMLLKHDAEEVWHRVGGEDIRERRARFEQSMTARRCSTSGAYQVADIWKAVNGAGDIDVDDATSLKRIYSLVNFDNFRSARVVRGASPEALSLISDPIWSPERHLRDGGSTHNVYLDWFFFEGRAALLLFLLFAGLLAATSFAAAWRVRASQWAPFAWAVCLQVLVILAFMYAQPYIWLKYYWVVFGLASALAIKGGARATAA